MRLDKMLCQMGLGTRSAVREIVRAGRVAVDAQIARDPGLGIDPERHAVSLDGTPLLWKHTRTVMLHKPTGVLTAARDKKQPTVLDLLPPLYRAQGCMPAGRLDKDTSGLLILTTDGQLAHRLIAPNHEIPKRYRARLDGPLGEDDVRAFAKGLAIEDADGAFVARPAALCILSSCAGESEAEVVVTEGKYHQVRRMFAARGRTVTALCRLSIGGLALDPALAPGAYRELTEAEVALLERTAP